MPLNLDALNSSFVDKSTFEQILEMDEEGDYEFSLQLVLGFFEQAKHTLRDFDGYLSQKDLHNLSNLGHFLRGSSATLGFVRVHEQCDNIWHWGMHEKAPAERRDENDKILNHSDEDILKRIGMAIQITKTEVGRVHHVMKQLYGPELWPAENEEQEE